jgi:hypothetical protein
MDIFMDQASSLKPKQVYEDFEVPAEPQEEPANSPWRLKLGDRLDDKQERTGAPIDGPQAFRKPGNSTQPPLRRYSDDEFEEEIRPWKDKGPGLSKWRIVHHQESSNVHYNPPPPPCELWPPKSRPDLQSYLPDSWPVPHQDRLYVDEYSNRWKAIWNEQLQWWFWVIKSTPANGDRGQHAADQEHHGQRVKDDPGQSARGPDGYTEIGIEVMKHPSLPQSAAPGNADGQSMLQKESVSGRSSKDGVISLRERREKGDEFQRVTKECPHCHQHFGISSFAVHLRGCTSKDRPEGIQNIDEIRQQCEGHRRQTSREGSTPKCDRDSLQPTRTASAGTGGTPPANIDVLNGEPSDWVAKAVEAAEAKEANDGIKPLPKGRAELKRSCTNAKVADPTKRKKRK